MELLTPCIPNTRARETKCDADPFNCFNLLRSSEFFIKSLRLFVAASVLRSQTAVAHRNNASYANMTNRKYLPSKTPGLRAND
jgi:hypothetical protein